MERYMNILSIYRSHLVTRRNYQTIGAVALGSVAAYILSGYIINDQILDLEFIALGVAVCVLIVVILNNWRRGLMIFLCWLLFEDLVRKYLGNNMVVYFGKDVLVAVFYLSFFMAVRKQKGQIFRPPFRIPLLLMVWFGIIQVLNPASPSIFYGLMGLKMFFFYVPLMFVGYSLLNSEEELRRFFFFNLILILVISSLGVAQAIIGHTFLNPEVIQEDIR